MSVLVNKLPHAFLKSLAWREQYVQWSHPNDRGISWIWTGRATEVWHLRRPNETPWVPSWKDIDVYPQRKELRVYVPVGMVFQFVGFYSAVKEAWVKRDDLFPIEFPMEAITQTEMIIKDEWTVIVWQDKYANA